MSKETYIGGAFAANDSIAFQLPKGEINCFFDGLPEPVGFETGADALAWILLQEFNESVRPVYFPLHYCEETIERICLKVPEMRMERYASVTEIPRQPAIVIWNHFNGHIPVPAALLTEHITLIEDCVQSLLSLKKQVGKASFTSFRKWLEEDLAPVFGPYSRPAAETLPSAYYVAKKVAEQQKERWKKGVSQDESVFLQAFAAAEQQLHNSAIYLRDCDLLQQYDWEKIIACRNENAHTLRNLIAETGVEIIAQQELFLMIRLENRDRVRKELTKQGIFAPIHWLDSADLQQAKTLLSLPVDQRYDSDDMHRIASALAHGINVGSV